MLVLRNGARSSRIPGGLDLCGSVGALTFSPRADPGAPCRKRGLIESARPETDAAAMQSPKMARLWVDPKIGGLTCGLKKWNTARKNRLSGGTRRAITKPPLWDLNQAVLRKRIELILDLPPPLTIMVVKLGGVLFDRGFLIGRSELVQASSNEADETLLGIAKAA